jgi:tight adherence protein B
MRGSVTALLVAAAVLLWGAPAASAPPASLTDVRVEDGAVSTVLTARTPVPLADVRLRATVDGEERPVSIDEEARTERSVMLVIDTSGSMGAEGMATVRSAVSEYLGAAPADVRVGVASFAATSGVDLAPTTRRGQVQRAVDGLAADGDTDLFGGVQAATRALRGRDGDRSIVLLSDGADTVSPAPRRALARASRAVRRHDVRLDVVRFKTDDPAAVRSLAGLARSGHGTVVAADAPRAVARAFSQAAGLLQSQVSLTVDTGRVSDPVPLVVTGRGGDVDFVARTTLRPAVGDPVPDPEPDAAAAAGGTTSGGTGLSVDRAGWWHLPALGAASLAVGAFLLGIAYLVPRRTRREQRIDAIQGYLPWEHAGAGRTRPRGTALSTRLVALGDQVAAGRRSTPRTVQLIRRADLRFTPGEWLVLRALAVVVPVLLTLLLTRTWWLVLLVAAIGMMVPALVLRLLASRRATAFERQLPDVLFLMATSLNSGFGLSQALDAVVRDAPDPVATELARAQAETRLGTDLVDALDRVAVRMDSTTMAWTVMAMRIQSDVGGNLAETLRTTAQTLRDRESLHRQVRTLSAEGRLSAVILIALPIALFFYMMAVNRDYLSLLWSTGLGILMLVATGALLAIGVFWMRRVVQVEV